MYKKVDLQYIFSYSGLIPFFIFKIDKFFLLKIKEEISINFLIYYTVIILVFIGSVNWNFNIKVRNNIIIHGFFPSFVALIIIILNLYHFNASYLIISLAFFLLIQLIFDYYLIFSDTNKSVFFFLRLPLTLIIIISLLIIIFW